MLSLILLAALGTTLHDAANVALSHNLSLLPEERPHYRYTFNADKQVLDELLNSTISHTSRIVRSIEIAPGVFAFNVHHLNAVRTYESIREPLFTNLQLVDCQPYTLNGKTYKQKWIRQPLLTLAPIHLKLQETTQSTIPIIEFNYLNTVARTAVEGFYYELRGIKGLTLDQYLERRGYNRNKAKQTEVIERVTMIQSQITGKPRQVEVFPGAGTAPSKGVSVCVMTRDVLDLPADDPFENPFEFKDQGRELILTLSNGHFEYTLWADQTLVDSAPEDLATDHLIPAPYTKVLQPSISCIRCHASDDGHKRLRIVNQDGTVVDKNDLKLLAPFLEHADEFLGNPENLIQLSRDGHAIAMVQTNNLDVVQTYSRVVKLFNDYNYTPVTLEQAEKELGFKIPESLSPYLILLKQGKSITRQQWLSVFQEAYELGYHESAPDPVDAP